MSQHKLEYWHPLRVAGREHFTQVKADAHFEREAAKAIRHANSQLPVIPRNRRENRLAAHKEIIGMRLPTGQWLQLVRDRNDKSAK